MVGLLPATVVVPTRDRPDALERCLAALDRQSVGTFDVMVVDDGSERADEVRAVVARHPSAKLVAGEGRGPAAARNLGASGASNELVCFTDDDCEPDPDWLAAFGAGFAGGADVVAGPTLARLGSNAFVRASQLVTNHLVDASRDAAGAVGFAPTSNIACRRVVHDAVPFDESFPTAAGEDRVWCDRLHESGYDIEFAPAAIVRHAPALDGPGFWRQQTRYGAGATRYFSSRDEKTRPQPANFYVDLVQRAFREGASVGALVLVAQLATAAGAASEIYRARTAA